MNPQGALRPGVGLAAEPSRLPSLLAAGALTLVGAGVAAALALGQPLWALALPLAVAGLYALLKLPLKVAVLGTLLLVLVLEGLQYPLGTFEREWPVPVLHPVAQGFLLNLSTLMGGGPLRAPVVDLLTLALFFLSMMGRVAGGRAAPPPTVTAVERLAWASAFAAVALVGLGVVQGGSFNESLWQVRHTVLFPVRAVVLMRALDCTPAELRLIGRLWVGAAVLKAAIGLWFLYAVAPGLGLDPQFTTSHTDTLLFVPVLALFAARALEARSARELLAGLGFAPLVFWGMVANDRRIAYVSLCVGVVVLAVMAPRTPVKRALARGLLVLAPLLPAYLVLGWSSDGRGAFFPVGVLRSLVVGERRYVGEVDYRDLENLDVLYTWSRHPVVPMGFGHPFELLFPLPDISAWFAEWQYHPHNSVLWFFAAGGPLGFTLMVLPHVATLYLAARALRASRDFTERVALWTCVVTVIAFFNQLWGDMGTLQWTASWAAALAAAVAARLAMKTGAWPTVPVVRRDAGGVEPGLR